MYVCIVYLTVDHQPAYMTYRVAHPLGVVRKVMGWMLGLNCVIAKDIKCCTYYCYFVRSENALALNRQNSLPFCIVRLPDKGRAIKELVVCYVVCILYRICEENWSQDSCKERVVLVPVVVRIANELKYRNNPQKHCITVYHIRYQDCQFHINNTVFSGLHHIDNKTVQ